MNGKTSLFKFIFRNVIFPIPILIYNWQLAKMIITVFYPVQLLQVFLNSAITYLTLLAVACLTLNTLKPMVLIFLRKNDPDIEITYNLFIWLLQSIFVLRHLWTKNYRWRKRLLSYNYQKRFNFLLFSIRTFF